jgi:ribosomal-protein-alanine N-acetyltransferase
MRAAHLSDAEEIAELESLLFDNSMGERMIRHELKLGRGWVEEGTPLKGYVLTRREEGVMDITRLGVHPSAHRQGIGTTLLLQAMKGARDVVLTVQKDNVGAMKLYFKYGFEIVGHLQSANAWVMRSTR